MTAFSRLNVSVGLASELLLGRYAMPASRYPDCLLSRHERGLFSECQEILKKVGPQNHRGDVFNRLVLPQCRPLVEAIGHRMAYEAALDAGVDQHLLALYEAGVVKLDGSWYAEHAGLGHLAQFEMEERAASAAAPFIERYLSQTEAEAYAHAPILTKDRWDSFMQGLESTSGNASLAVLPEGVPLHDQSGMMSARL